MKLSPILMWLPLAIDSVAGATARTRSVSNSVERTRGLLRSLGVSAESRHDDPPGAMPSNRIPPPPESQQPPQPRTGRQERPRDVFDRDPDESAIPRHDDDVSLSPGAGEKRQDTAMRHDDDPQGRDVSGQFSFAPSTTNRLLGPPSAAPSASAAPAGQPSSSPAPSVYPSLTPSDIPTLSSGASSFDCTSDDAGFFAGSGLNSVTVNYRYEMEYIDTTNLDVDDIFKAVEKQASDAVLPDLFPGQCTVQTDSPTASLSPSITPSISMLPTSEGNSTDEGGGEGTRMLVEGRRRLEAIGLSPQPADALDETATCVIPATSQISACNIAQGGMTVFLLLGTTEDGEIEIVRAALKASMDAGEFNAVHPALRRISYVDEVNTPGPTPKPPISPSPKSGSSDGGIPIWASVLIALGGLLFIGLGVFVWRRRRTREAIKDADTRDDDYAEDMEEIDEDQSYEPPDGMSRLTTQQEEEFDDYGEDSKQ